MKSNRLEWLDLFRGIAALTVVAFHFHYGVHLPKFRFGPLAVDLFFVLSGIVLGRKYHPAILQGMPFGEFAWHRMRRLYPMVLITAGFIVAMNITHVPELPWSLGSPAAVASLVSLTTFDADPPAWSLQAELAANIVWFACLQFGRRFTFAMFGLMMVAFLLIAFHDGGISTGVIHEGVGHYVRALVRALAWFGVGCAISVHGWQLRVPVWLTLAALLAACALVESERVNGAVADLLVILSGTALLMTLMPLSPRSAAVSKACRALGILSFPIYLIHMPASRLASWVAAHGVRTTIAYVGAFVVVGVAAAAFNEWVVNRLPPSILRRKARAVEEVT